MRSTLGAYGIALAIQRAFGILMVPVLTWAVSPAELGAFAVLTTLAFITFMTLVDLGIGTMAFRVASEDDANPSEVFVTVLWTRVVAALVVGAVVLSLRGPVAHWLVRDSDATLAVSLAWGTVLARAITQTLTDWYRHLHRDRAVAIYVGALGVLEPLLAVLLVVVCKLGFTGWIAALLTAQVVAGLPLAVGAKEMVLHRGSASMARRLLRLGIPVGLMQSLHALRDLDRYLVARLESLPAAGVYEVAIKLAAPIAALNVLLALALEPRALAAREPPKLLKQASAFINVYTAYAASGAFLVAMCAPEILLVFAPEYRGAAAAAGVLVFVPVLEVHRRVFGLPLDLAQRTRGWLWVTLANAGVALGVAVALVPRLGGLGAALGLTAGAALGAWVARAVARGLEGPMLRALGVAAVGGPLAAVALHRLPVPVSGLPLRLALAATFAIACFVLIPAGASSWRRMAGGLPSERG